MTLHLNDFILIFYKLTPQLIQLNILNMIEFYFLYCDVLFFCSYAYSIPLQKCKVYILCECMIVHAGSLPLTLF